MADIFGTIFRDFLRGTNLSDLIGGWDGDDTILGYGGDDHLNGMNGNDTVKGGSGNDRVYGGSGDDVLHGDEGNDYLAGNDGNNSLYGGTGNDRLQGGNQTDFLNGGSGWDTMSGGGGNDTYVVDHTADRVIEFSGQGVDEVRAHIHYTLGANVENLTLVGNEDLNGTGNNLNNVITGTSGDNVLLGAGGHDTLIGAGGNDWLNGGSGNDSMQGGAGDDVYIIDSAQDVVIEQAGQGNDLVKSHINTTLGANVERLQLQGSGNLTGNGNTLDNVITGNAGHNILRGAVGNDTLRASSGNDVLDGGQGNDRMEGGWGNDTYYVNSAADAVIEHAGQGTDLVLTSMHYTLGAHVENLTLTGSGHKNGTGNDLNNVIRGNTGNNVLKGGLGADTLVGGAGRDWLNGQIGNDTMDGGQGDDSFVVNSAGDRVIERAGQGVDKVYASVSYALGANVENLKLDGRHNINGTGNSLNNVITGNVGNNILTGAQGDDLIDGGGGNDTVDGGSGRDTLALSSSYDPNAVQWLNASSYRISGHTVSNVEVVRFGDGTEISLTPTNATTKLVIRGTAGDDTNLRGTAANDRIDALAGNDRVLGGGGHDVILGRTGNDQLIGGTGNDQLYGGGGADTLNGEAGNDTLIGGTGGDTLRGGGGNDFIDGGNDGSTDRVITPGKYERYILSYNAEAGRYILDDRSNAQGRDVLKNVEHIVFDGGGRVDLDYSANFQTRIQLSNSGETANGTPFDDRIFGGQGDDVIDGGAGDDEIIPKGGNDTISGGTGQDTIILSGSARDHQISEVDAYYESILFSDLNLESQLIYVDQFDVITFADDPGIRIKWGGPENSTEAILRGSGHFPIVNDSATFHVYGGLVPLMPFEFQDIFLYGLTDFDIPLDPDRALFYYPRFEISATETGQIEVTESSLTITGAYENFGNIYFDTGYATLRQLNGEVLGFNVYYTGDQDPEDAAWPDRNTPISESSDVFITDGGSGVFGAAPQGPRDIDRLVVRKEGQVELISQTISEFREYGGPRLTLKYRIGNGDVKEILTFSSVGLIDIGPYQFQPIYNPGSPDILQTYFDPAYEGDIHYRPSSAAEHVLPSADMQGRLVLDLRDVALNGSHGYSSRTPSDIYISQRTQDPSLVLSHLTTKDWVFHRKEVLDQGDVWSLKASHNTRADDPIFVGHWNVELRDGNSINDVDIRISGDEIHYEFVRNRNRLDPNIAPMYVNVDGKAVIHDQAQSARYVTQADLATALTFLYRGGTDFIDIHPGQSLLIDWGGNPFAHQLEITEQNGVVAVSNPNNSNLASEQIIYLDPNDLPGVVFELWGGRYKLNEELELVPDGPVLPPPADNVQQAVADMFGLDREWIVEDGVPGFPETYDNRVTPLNPDLPELLFLQSPTGAIVGTGPTAHDIGLHLNPFGGLSEVVISNLYALVAEGNNTSLFTGSVNAPFVLRTHTGIYESALVDRVVLIETGPDNTVREMASIDTRDLVLHVGDAIAAGDLGRRQISLADILGEIAQFLNTRPGDAIVSETEDAPDVTGHFASDFESPQAYRAHLIEQGVLTPGEFNGIQETIQINAEDLDIKPGLAARTVLAGFEPGWDTLNIDPAIFDNFDASVLDSFAKTEVHGDNTHILFDVDGAGTEHSFQDALILKDQHISLAALLGNQSLTFKERPQDSLDIPSA